MAQMSETAASSEEEEEQVSRDEDRFMKSNISLLNSSIITPKVEYENEIDFLDEKTFQEKVNDEIDDMKAAIKETFQPLTFLAVLIVFLASYLSLIGWGPYLGPQIGPWLFDKGFPLNHQWAEGKWGGFKTRLTNEGIVRNHQSMQDFASKVRVLPEENELACLKTDLKHLKSNIGFIHDEIHRDPLSFNENSVDSNRMNKMNQQTQSKSNFELKWGGAEFYSPNPTIIQSNLTLGMLVGTHQIHGHSHMRLPGQWYDCLHIGISTWNLVEIARETRLKNSYFQDDVEVEAGKDPLEFNLEALQAKYEESDAELEQRIKELAIQPSDVLPWFGHHNKTGFLLEGFALKYCPEDLEAQGVLLNGPGRDPYAKAIQSVASLARSLNSPTTSPPSVLMLWYGHRWGSDINVVGDDDVYKHMNVLQEIYPVVTGLQSMRFSGVAHRTNAPIPPMNPITRIPSSKTIPPN